MSFGKIIDALNEKDYGVFANWLPAEEVSQLGVEFYQLKKSGQFKPAGVSKAHLIVSDIRSDEICWFEPHELLPAQESLWERLQSLREELNRELFLGLWDLEGHFAAYPQGGFYRRHLDRFSNDDARTVTVVLYLNENWRPNHGGELVIFTGGSSNETERCVIVEPRAGTLVVFMSAKIEHQVRQAYAARQSFAGWYRRRR
jgi:SM-20-related protein